MAHILLVDDEPALLRSYARLLSAAGHETTTASDGKDAIEILGRTSFDVILSDIMMPGLGGIELLRLIHAKDLDVPVIMMTASPMLETAIQAMEHGAHRYLLKPVDSDELCQVVSRAATLHQLARLKREALDYLGTSQGRLGERSTLEASFGRALRSLWMAIQPIVRCSTQTVYGWEALVRSREPALPHPGALLSAAEKLGTLPELGRMIRMRAAGAMSELGPDAFLFVNLHTQDLLDDSLYSASSELSKIAPRVVLEVTERASLDDMDDVPARAARLRALGFRIAIDDLGAGYAGLTSFASLEPEVVKLDMSLVRNIHGEPTKQKLVRSMVTLCKDLGIQIIAEGVETAAERDMLLTLGCDLLQGYLFGKPAAHVQAITWG